jgi:PAS domain S-box-containing protein
MTRAGGWHGLFWDAFKRSHNAMVLLDERRCHVEVNGAYLELLGYRRHALLGRPVYEIVVDGPVLNAQEWRVAMGQEQFTGTADMLRADGGRVTVQFAGHPELVTGRRLILGVALNTARAGRRMRDQSLPAEDARSLTAREREVVRLMALGSNGPEIAAELHLSHNTVRTHARNAMSKLGARSRAHLVAMALGEPRHLDQAA